jgi:hypothetical protein
MLDTLVNVTGLEVIAESIIGTEAAKSLLLFGGKRCLFSLMRVFR